MRVAESKPLGWAPVKSGHSVCEWPWEARSNASAYVGLPDASETGKTACQHRRHGACMFRSRHGKMIGFMVAVFKKTSYSHRRGYQFAQLVAERCANSSRAMASGRLLSAEQAAYRAAAEKLLN